MPPRVCFVDFFLRVTPVYLPCTAAKARQGNHSENSLQNLLYEAFCSRLFNKNDITHLFQLVDRGRDADDGHNDDGHRVGDVLVSEPQCDGCDLGRQEKNSDNGENAKFAPFLTWKT